MTNHFTADMLFLIGGIVTVNTEIAEKVGIDYSIFKDMCSELIETVTAEEFN